MIPSRSITQALVFCGLVALGAPQAPAEPTFRLHVLGHGIGQETDLLSADGRHLDAAFHFEDRGTAIDLTGSLDFAGNEPVRLVVKGRNYRLFTSDAEVTIADGRARVRDLAQETEVAVGGRPVFPLDNYAPIGVQERLIQYWLSHGRPKEILAPPAGVVRIESRGGLPSDAWRAEGVRVPQIERVAISGVVWGTETAWFEQESGRLVALMTWAGALPFEAFREGFDERFNARAFYQSAVADRIADLSRLTNGTPTIQRDTFALVGARVITGHRTAPIERATVVVRNGRIAASGPSASTPVPRGVPEVDVAGKTIVAGLWDMHAHASQIDWAPVYLASGVTAIRDMGGEEGFLVAIRDAIAAGLALGPRYLLAGLIDGPGPRAFGAVIAATADEGRAVVRRYHDERFDEIKIYSLVAPDVVRAIVDEAHELGMRVTGHVPQGMTPQSVVEAGFDSIAHMQLRGTAGSDASKAEIAFFRMHDTVMDPTESWNELGGHPAATPLESFLPGVWRLPRPLTRMFASMPGGTGDSHATHARLIEGVKLLKTAVDRGLVVVAGTDKGVPGFSLQRELELYVEGGMTPLEALQAATLMPAHAAKLDRELGTIDVGKRADLVVLDANPLDDISNIRTARMVASNGRLYDCNALWRAAGFTPR